MATELVRPQKNLSDKIFEKIPPILTWGIIFFPLFGSFLFPEVVAIFVLTFNVYFLYRSISLTVQFVLSLILLREASQIDWFAKVSGLDHIEEEIKHLKIAQEKIKAATFSKTYKDQLDKKLELQKFKFPNFLARIVFFWSKLKTRIFVANEIEDLKEFRDKDIYSYKELNHVVIIPHAKEPYRVLDRTLEKISNSTFPTKQIHIVLGAEERDPEGVEKSKKLQAKYSKVFGNVWISVHHLESYEIVGKSSNMAAAGRKVYEEIQKLGWDLKRTTVTSCDADSQLPEEYFSILAYKFLTTEQAEYKFYTGAILFYANIWRIDFIARVRNSLASIYNVSKMVRPDKFIPFSTYSSSFWLVKEAGFWTPWVTPEDFHMFFKSSLIYSDKVSTIPLLVRVYSDAAEGEGMVDTFKNNYYQSRRWQWGVSDDGWLLKNLIVKFGKLNYRVYWRAGHVFADHILAPTSSFLILLGANLPPLLNPAFRNTVFGAKLPGMSSLILRITLAAFIVAIIFDIFLKPKRDGVSLIRKILTPFEWFLNPIVGYLLTSLPGIEAHTRLLFGKYLEYYITKKKA